MNPFTTCLRTWDVSIAGLKHRRQDFRKAGRHILGCVHVWPGKLLKMFFQFPTNSIVSPTWRVQYPLQNFHNSLAVRQISESRFHITYNLLVARLCFGSCPWQIAFSARWDWNWAIFWLPIATTNYKRLVTHWFRFLVVRNELLIRWIFNLATITEMEQSNRCERSMSANLFAYERVTFEAFFGHF